MVAQQTKKILISKKDIARDKAWRDLSRAAKRLAEAGIFGEELNQIIGLAESLKRQSEL
jgi:hypothetical protein